MANKHLIGKQIWELSIQGPESAYAIQQAVSDMVREKLLPVFTEVFDRIAGDDEVLTIDSLEVNLGNIEVGEIGSPEMVAKIVRYVEDQCFRAKFMNQGTGYSFSGGQEAPRSRSREAYFFELWLHWLQTGTLPSHSLTPDHQWMDWVLEALGLNYRAADRLEKILKTQPHVLRRLVLQHSSRVLQALAELYTGHSQAGLTEFLKELEQVGLPGKENRDGNFRAFETAYWEIILKKAIQDRQKLQAHELLHLVINSPLFSGLAGNFRVESRQYPMLGNFLATASQALEKPPPGVVGEETNAPNKMGEKQIFPVLEWADGKEPCFVKNAGLVLLHPFMVKLFHNLGLLEGAVFKDFASQSKAVSILQFMANGSEAGMDYELVLPKFLCGMPWNLPVDYLARLEEVEVEETLEVLRAAVTHWEALGNVSPDGLREGFLMRDGKLLKESGGWKLYVETKAIDVLLDRLPWNLSLIKLPWMSELLKVEWR